MNIITLSKEPIDISSIKANVGENLLIKYKGSLKNLIEDIEFRGEAFIEIVITTKGNQQFIAEGSIEIEVVLLCERCLEDFPYPIKKNFKVEYLPFVLAPQISTKVLVEEELDNLFYQDDEIDILELIREEILLNIPIKPLCRIECKGLCSHCGINLNKYNCRCREVNEDVDVRFLPLKSLLKKKEETDGNNKEKTL